MKSKLFNRFDPSAEGNEEFKLHLHALIAMSELKLRTLFSAMPAILNAGTEVEKGTIVDKLEADMELPRTKLQGLLNIAAFLLSALGKDSLKGDRTEDWADDLQSLKLLTAKTRPRFVKVAELLKSGTLQEIQRVRRDIKAAGGVIPSFLGASTTVELRGVIEDEFKWGNSVEDFAPKILSIKPIVSLAIRLDSGTPSRFYFQVASDDLEYLILELRAAQKSAQALQDSVMFKP